MSHETANFPWFSPKMHNTYIISSFSFLHPNPPGVLLSFKFMTSLSLIVVAWECVRVCVCVCVCEWTMATPIDMLMWTGESPQGFNTKKKKTTGNTFIYKWTERAGEMAQGLRTPTVLLKIWVQIPVHMQTYVELFLTPALGKQRQENSWTCLASQSIRWPIYLDQWVISLRKDGFSDSFLSRGTGKRGLEMLGLPKTTYWLFKSRPVLFIRRQV